MAVDKTVSPISVNSSSAISFSPMKATITTYPSCCVINVMAVVVCPSASSLGYRCHSKPDPESVSIGSALKVYSNSAQSGSDSSASIIVMSLQSVVMSVTACCCDATCSVASGLPPVSSVIPATSMLPAPLKFDLPKSMRVMDSESASIGDQSSCAIGLAQDSGVTVMSSTLPARSCASWR